MGLLTGVRVVEFEALGPAPFCGMLLADLGADVIVIERQAGAEAQPQAVFKRGKRSIVLDLKNDAARAIALDILASADALIEGLRPGVMERLGLGPEAVHARNRKLVYGRMTGWGQTGPLAQAAGHDLNYVSLSSAGWYAGEAGAAPTPPPTMVGDIGGGALYLAIGVLAGVLKARETGAGTVVDAAIVDGSAHMMNLLFSLRAAGALPDARGKSMLDGAHFYANYKCADDKWISIGALEPKFYAEFLERMGLKSDPLFADQHNREKWPACKERLTTIFAERPRAHWEKMLYATDACFAPVLSPSEAMDNDHMKARAIFRTIGGVLQAAAAPRFDGEAPADPSPIPAPGAHAQDILSEIGIDDRDIAKWREDGAFGS